MHNCKKTGGTQLPFRESQSLTYHQQGLERGDILGQICGVDHWIENRAYCTIKSICREILEEQIQKECREQYLVFDGDKGMKKRLYKYEQQYCPNSTRGKGRNVFASDQVVSLKHWSSCPSKNTRFKKISDDECRLRNRVRGGYSAETVVERKVKGKGKSKFPKFDDKDCKTDKSKQKSRTNEADKQSSDSGLMEKLTKRKKGRVCKSNNESADEFDRSKKLKPKGSDCGLNEEKIKNRGGDKSSCKITDVDNERKNSATKMGYKKCTEPLIGKNSSEDLETGQQKIDKVIEKRGSFSTAKKRKHRLIKPTTVKSGKEVLMAKDTEKFTSEEKEKKIRAKRKRRFKCKDRNSKCRIEKHQSMSAVKECENSHRHEGKQEEKAARADEKYLEEISLNIRRRENPLVNFQKKAFQYLFSSIN